ncbi:hypothetical protein GCM10007036_44190 [Alsobacter metallidurans]|uniref:Uncharacterized protein n=1 Tax=Alsobacter metallidurans TaxID=340221 RepID=A0A917IB31_9HYPH|nr:hypothetical protein GCM10007036_44190 [Alsobacter metallidurans]
METDSAERRDSAGRAARRADAGFVAQLLALRAGLPAQRLKRRAAPETGAAAYETSLSRKRPLARPDLDIIA